jgi:hypothetical protein
MKGCCLWLVLFGETDGVERPIPVLEEGVKQLYGWTFAATKSCLSPGRSRAELIIPLALGQSEDAADPLGPLRL